MLPSNRVLMVSSYGHGRYEIAGSVFIAIPIVILYFCLVKYIVNGLTAGSVKG